MKIAEVKRIFFQLLLFIIYDVYITFVIKIANNYGPLKFLYILSFSEVLLVVLFFCFNYYFYDLKFNSIDNLKKMNIFRAFIFSVVVALLLFTIQNLYHTYLQSYIFGNLPTNRNQLAVLSLEKIAPTFSFISSVIIAPIIEEIFYRQMLFGVFYELYVGCNKWVKFFTASLFSSLVFSLSHHGTFFSPYTIVYTLYGVFFSAVYLYTKRISCAILCHGCVNFMLKIFRILNI